MVLPYKGSTLFIRFIGNEQPDNTWVEVGGEEFEVRDFNNILTGSSF